MFKFRKATPKPVTILTVKDTGRTSSRTAEVARVERTRKQAHKRITKRAMVKILTK